MWGYYLLLFVDDLWIVLRDFSFDLIFIFLVKSIYYGLILGNEVEIELIFKFFLFNWNNEGFFNEY